jgi:hypothetical protein
MKQLSLLDYQVIAALKARQRAIASHYADIAINRDRLESEAQEAHNIKQSKEY